MSSWLGAWVLLIGLALPCPAALANGNYSHVWVATDSLQYLPPGGLRNLLNQPDLVEILRNGAMYPDGGYAVDDGYGETSHWEPFHLTYLQWIRGTYTQPWSREAAEHIAFLMGMATHGMTDQLYDGMYLQRHEHYDENRNNATPYGVDGSTDVCFAATQGPMEVPVSWVPADALAPLYQTLDGHQVDPDTIRLGHSLVAFAITHATTEAADPAIVADYMTIYPWACGNQDNLDAAGSPPTCGPAVANYWQVLWARLNGTEAFDQPLLGTFFTNRSSWNQVVDATNPESWVSFAMPHGLDPSSLGPESVVVTRKGGAVHPVKVNVFYRSNSHLVNVKPVGDWEADAEYTVTVGLPLSDWKGVPLATSYTFTFGTLPPPIVEPTEELGGPDEPGAEVTESVEPVADVIEPTEDVLAPTEDASDVPDVGTEDSAPEPGKSGSGCQAQRPGDAAPTGLLLIGLLLVAAAGMARVRQAGRVEHNARSSV